MSPGPSASRCSPSLMEESPGLEKVSVRACKNKRMPPATLNAGSVIWRSDARTASLLRLALVSFKRDAQIREEWKEFGRTWQKTVDGVVTERAQSNAGEKEQQLSDRKLKPWLRSGAQKQVRKKNCR